MVDPQVPEPYRVFTQRFDRIIRADQMSLPVSEAAWTIFLEKTLESRTAWEIHGLERAQHLKNSITENDFKNSLVTLLIDHSGSMRGERMLMTAAAVDVACVFLSHLGVRVEILGFTTRSWRGGWSRVLWKWTGRKKLPGRLCDLLHIIYKEAGSHRQSGSSMRSLAHMLNPKLLKENVDGEAILWAVSRQDATAFSRKAIIVISDGAPVDDSTLMENGLRFLTDHLKEVVSTLKPTRVMALLQIGNEAEIEFPITGRVEMLSQIGTDLFDLLSKVLLAFSDQSALPSVKAATADRQSGAGAGSC